MTCENTSTRKISRQQRCSKFSNTFYSHTMLRHLLPLKCTQGTRLFFNANNNLCPVLTTWKCSGLAARERGDTGSLASCPRVGSILHRPWTLGVSMPQAHRQSPAESPPGKQEPRAGHCLQAHSSHWRGQPVTNRLATKGVLVSREFFWSLLAGRCTCVKLGPHWDRPRALPLRLPFQAGWMQGLPELWGPSPCWKQPVLGEPPGGDSQPGH